MIGSGTESSRYIPNSRFPSLFPSYMGIWCGDRFAETACTTTHSGDRENFLGSSQKSHLLGHFRVSAPAIPVSGGRKDGNSRVLAVRSLALAKPFPGREDRASRIPAKRTRGGHHSVWDHSSYRMVRDPVSQHCRLWQENKRRSTSPLCHRLQADQRIILMKVFFFLISVHSNP